MKWWMIACAAVAFDVACADTRVWTSASGKQVEAEFVELRRGDVILREPDGSRLLISLRGLSGEDRKFIAEAESAPDLAVVHAKFNGWDESDGDRLDAPSFAIRVQRRNGGLWAQSPVVEVDALLELETKEKLVQRVRASCGRISRSVLRSESHDVFRRRYRAPLLQTEGPVEADNLPAVLTWEAHPGQLVTGEGLGIPAPRRNFGGEIDEDLDLRGMRVRICCGDREVTAYTDQNEQFLSKHRIPPTWWEDSHQFPRPISK